jgi:branched-chain amino acid transport system ATP-binding protein
VLHVRDIEMTFGGVKALSDVTFDISPGAIAAIIGPNGAGKTTLFNVVSGLYRPSRGSVQWNGEELVGLEPHQLAGKGIARTFQNPQVLDGTTALQIVQIGCHTETDRSLWSALCRLASFRRCEQAVRNRCIELLEFVGLGEHAETMSASLSYGQIKRLDIARALGCRPQLLIMDEPAAGLNGAETNELKLLLQKVVASGVTVVLVEHDMKLVMELSEHIVVLNHGQVLTQGRPAEVRANPQVLAAYLGSDALEAA